MKICLLGEFLGPLDEGMRKISFHLAKELSKRNEVLTLDLRTAFNRSFWKSIKSFAPEVVHYIHGGSPKSFLLLKLISRYLSNAKTVISVMQFSPSSLRIVPLFKPDLVLVQTKELEKKFRRQSCNVEFLPCGGVDLDRHRENREGKILLKEKYGIDRDKFVILHVGSIKRSRNVQSLTKLQTDENQVVIVGSTSVGVEMELYHQLERSGCLVLLQYIERIEEVYALADCYVFPVVPKKNLLESAKVACIDIPLSVLEAMAHNLPVVSTKFGALPDIFEEGNGLFFVEREEEFISALNKVKSCKDVRTREKVEAYSWGNIAKRLEQVYSKLIGGEIGR